MTLNVHHISEFFDHWAPFDTQTEYDNSGLLIGSSKMPVSGVVTCLDVTEQVVDEALSRNANLIVAHHPLIFRKLSRINPDDHQGALLYKLISSGIAVLAVHTNLDAARNGVSFVLAECMGLESLKLLTHHDTDGKTGFGVVGLLPTRMAGPDFLNHICNSLGTKAVRYSAGTHTMTEGITNSPDISKVAVCGGTAVSLLKDAKKAGADAFVTADIKYHEYFDPGLLLVDAGHFETEQPVVAHMAAKLSDAFPELPVHPFDEPVNPMQVFISPNFKH